MVEHTPDPEPTTSVAAADLVSDPPSTRPSVDDMGEASLPASDPPAVWTWEPPPPAR